MPFAEEMISAATADALVAAVEAAAPDTRPLTALRAAARTLAEDPTLRLRERAVLLRDALLTDVPGDLARLDGVVRAAAAGDHPFEGWLIWPVTDAVATRAVAEGSDAAVDAALDLLAALTGRLTSEFALRILLRHDLDRALATIAGWTGSPDEHVRRLASEGTRPYLPWAARVDAVLRAPEATVPLLDALHRDESPYVRRSVANHLNDLSRLSPELAVTTAERWLAAPHPTTPQLVRHGLRTLVKRADPAALRLLGHAPADAVLVDGPLLAAATVPFHGDLVFSVRLTNTGADPLDLVVDYRVHHRKANGTRTPKAFRLVRRTLAAGAALDLQRTHSFRPITTRRYHPGVHAIDLQVNGLRGQEVEFTLQDPAPRTG